MLGRSQLGEGGPPGVLTVLQPWRLAGTGPCTSKKKFRSCRCLRRYRGGQLPGSGATHLCYHLFSRKRAFRSQQQAFRACGGRTRAQPHGLTRFPGFSAVCRPGSPHRSVIVLRVPKPRPPEQPVRRRGTSRRGSGTTKTRPPPARITWLGNTGSGANAGSGPRRRRRPTRGDGHFPGF
jgi:hypothetical protein